MLNSKILDMIVSIIRSDLNELGDDDNMGRVEHIMLNNLTVKTYRVGNMIRIDINGINNTEPIK